MFNVTVLKMKDIIKYLVGVTITALIVIYSARYFSDLSKKKQINILKESTLLECLDETMPVISNLNKQDIKLDKESNQNKDTNYLKGFLKTQISAIDMLEEKIDVSNANQDIKEEMTDNTPQSTNLQLANTSGVKTEVVTKNPISESYNTQYSNVKIKNQTSYELTQEIMTPDITIDNKNIILFHTHSCESYTSSEQYPYVQTGNFRTTDLNFSVTKLGTELEGYLKKYNYNVIHDTSYHDYPSYTGSYTRSLQTVENLLNTTPSDIIIDIHRDAIGSREDYAPTVKIGEDYAAQIMFVIGTNAGGLWHPNWQQNLKFAIKIQEKAEEMYPGLFKPILLTESRYNQHTGKYASIIEVGATGNTLEQCLTSMKYLSAIMNEVMSQF